MKSNLQQEVQTHKCDKNAKPSTLEIGESIVALNFGSRSKLLPEIIRQVIKL